MTNSTLSQNSAGDNGGGRRGFPGFGGGRRRVETDAEGKFEIFGAADPDMDYRLEANDRRWVGESMAVSPGDTAVRFVVTAPGGSR